jgi:tetratricopeptide (TPR) repeat protein
MEMVLIKYVAPLLIAGSLAAVFTAMPGVQPASPDELAEVAVGYIKAKQESFGKDALREALAKEPGNHRANYVAGMLALQEERFPEAASHLKAAYEAKPDDRDALLSYGVACQRLNDYGAARAAYEAVRKAEPNNAKAAYNLGMLAIETLQYSVAKGCLEDYLRLQPDAPDKAFVSGKLNELSALLKKRKAV